MTDFSTLGQVVAASFQDVWYGLITFAPKILAAIIIFLLGWLVGSVVGRWVAHIIRSLKVDNALREVGTEDVLAKAGFRLNVGNFIGGLVKWFLIIVFLVASLDILALTQVTDFLRGIVLAYLPNVIVASLILIIAAIIADALQRIVTGSARAANVSSAKFLGSLVKWAIWVFAVLIALYQLGIGQEIMNNIITGVVAMLALAGGLAFGLGGRDAAGRYIEKIRQETAHVRE